MPSPVIGISFPSRQTTQRSAQFGNREKLCRCVSPPNLSRLVQVMIWLAAGRVSVSARLSAAICAAWRRLRSASRRHRRRSSWSPSFSWRIYHDRLLLLLLLLMLTMTHTPEPSLKQSASFCQPDDLLSPSSRRSLQRTSSDTPWRPEMSVRTCDKAAAAAVAAANVFMLHTYAMPFCGRAICFLVCTLDAYVRFAARPSIYRPKRNGWTRRRRLRCLMGGSTDLYLIREQQ